VSPGQALSLNGRAQTPKVTVEKRPPLYAVAVSARNRQDDVRVSGALGKLVEEDPGLTLIHDAELGQVLLAGQGEGHVRLALDRLKRRFGVDVATDRPRTPYRETIQKAASQRGRHKKQTGGHGQFGDVTLEIKPMPRGAGFNFVSRITGGVVPKQWIPAVEQGVRDGLSRGPLGFPVVDIEVALVDGSHHSVDSSEMAFRAAGRLGIEEGLRGCGATLLEPIERVVIYAPSSSLSNVNSAISTRRGQILGFAPREDWPGWERIEAYLPQAERLDLIAELRSITQGLGTFEADFDHMNELTGRLAEDVTQARPSA
jgi:elongation factor G